MENNKNINQSDEENDILNNTQNKLVDAEKQLLLKILDKNNYNNITFISLISLIAKQYNKDSIIQDFEANFLRQNDYFIKDFQTLENAIIREFNKGQKDKQNVEQTSNQEKINKYKWYIFIEIAQQMQIFSAQFQQLSLQTNNQNIPQQTNSTNYQQTTKEIDNLIDNALTFLNKTIEATDIKPNDDEKQQTFDVYDLKTYSLSPTQGIAMLNKNPYQFYAEKVLCLKCIDNWNSKIDARTYGTIIHEILQHFTYNCQSKDIDNITEDLFFETANKILNDYSLSFSSFIKSKIEIISKVAIKLEKNAKKHNRNVLCEKGFSHNFNGVKINAKADRVEIDDENKLIYICDYKTGNAPDDNDELKGKKTQLTIIALLMLQEENYNDYTIANNGLYYINFSGKQNQKIFNKIDTSIIFNRKKEFKSVEENLNELLKQYFENGKAISENMKIYITPSDFSAYDKELQIKHFARKSYFI